MPLVVVSYNILADAYIRAEHYPDSPAAVLAPARRCQALARHITNLAADVLCLQEVEPDVFQLLLAHLGPHGFEGHYARKGAGKPDGCATFLRIAVVTARAVRRLDYADAADRREPSGHLALIAHVELEGRGVAIANTHVKWDPPETPGPQRWGYRQIAQLLAGREALVPACPAWIICGDFNATADSPVVRLLEHAGFVDAYRARPDLNTCNPNRRA
jgi:endonuclease/exonuclease/phosphatase family metal-dependent hydrolase